MNNKKNTIPPTQPSQNGYDDHNTPEIDLPKPSNGISIIPDEVPRRDGPGGE